MQSLFSQQSLENFSFTECCLRQLPSCHQTGKNQESSGRCLLVRHLSPVGFSFFITQKSSQTGWGAGSVSASSPSAAASVPSSAASSSSGKCLPGGVWRWWSERSNELLACCAVLCLAGCAVRVSSLQKWVLLSSLPRVSDWRKDKLIFQQQFPV